MGVAMPIKKNHNSCMETIKNYIIAILLAVISLLLLTQPAQSASKAPSAVQLINYEACVHAAFDLNTQTIVQIGGGSGEIRPYDYFKSCKLWLTQTP
jgi:hypothetical protein